MFFEYFSLEVRLGPEDPGKYTWESVTDVQRRRHKGLQNADNKQQLQRILDSEQSSAYLLNTTTERGLS